MKIVLDGEAGSIQICLSLILKINSSHRIATHHRVLVCVEAGLSVKIMFGLGLRLVVLQKKQYLRQGYDNFL
jgi:hypothetical protein